MNNQDIVFDAEFMKKYIDKMNEAGYPVTYKVEAAIQVNTVFDIIMESLAQGKAVSRQGFGRFEVRHRQAHSGRNPQSGEVIALPASNSVGFKPGKKLRNAVADVEFAENKAGKLKPVVKDNLL